MYALFHPTSTLPTTTPAPQQPGEARGPLPTHPHPMRTLPNPPLPTHPHPNASPPNPPPSQPTACRYVLHLAFNLQNKAMLTAFPYPWFIATVHVVVGAAYCAALYALGSRSASFERVCAGSGGGRRPELVGCVGGGRWLLCHASLGRVGCCTPTQHAPNLNPPAQHGNPIPPIPHPLPPPRPQPLTRQELGTLLPAASMHALGHIASNLSFVAVALSLTHTVKTLEPAFSAVLQRLVLGEWQAAFLFLFSSCAVEAGAG